MQLIGDDSTSSTGPQPHQPVPQRLAPGQRPPQLLVFSWDEAANPSHALFPRFRALAQQHGGAMTSFLSGIHALPRSKCALYAPPQHPVGASDIALLDEEQVGDTMREVAQAKGFVTTWRTTTGRTDVPSLPFDHETELIGARTPCLEGQAALLPTAAALGWKYDASSPGGAQVWPGRKLGLWDLPLQAVPFAGAPAGRSRFALSMDDHPMYEQSGGDTRGDPAMRATWRAQARDAHPAGSSGR